jgi:chemotaxis protein histidine kinase CheA
MRQLTEAQRQALDALRVSYDTELPAKVRQIVRAAAALEAGGYDLAGIRRLHRHVHQLTGSAGVYGYDGLSRCAAAVAALTGAALKQGEPPRAEAQGALVRRLDAFQRAFGALSLPARRSGPAAGLPAKRLDAHARPRRRRHRQHS